MSDSESENIPDEIRNLANVALEETFPEKSKAIYERTYEALQTWVTENKTKIINEILLLAYLKTLSSQYAPNTLWTKYSMIRTMVYNEKNLEIDKYEKLKAFIKRKNTGYVTMQAETFDTVDVNQFLSNAPDNDYLTAEVSLLT